MAQVKEPILKKATQRLLADAKFASLRQELDAFRSSNSWVEDSALFYCLATFDEGTKETAWWTWPSPLRCVCDWTPAALPIFPPLRLSHSPAQVLPYAGR